jgi:hypothetical protein
MKYCHSRGCNRAPGYKNVTTNCGYLSQRDTHLKLLGTVVNVYVYNNCKNILASNSIFHSARQRILNYRLHQKFAAFLAGRRCMSAGEVAFHIILAKAQNTCYITAFRDKVFYRQLLPLLRSGWSCPSLKHFNLILNSVELYPKTNAIADIAVECCSRLYWLTRWYHVKPYYFLTIAI